MAHVLSELLSGWSLLGLRVAAQLVAPPGPGVRSKRGLIDAILAAAGRPEWRDRVVRHVVHGSPVATMRTVWRLAAPAGPAPRSRADFEGAVGRLLAAADAGAAAGAADAGGAAGSSAGGAAEADGGVLVPLDPKPLRYRLHRRWLRKTVAFLRRREHSAQIIAGIKAVLAAGGASRRVNEIRRRVFAQVPGGDPGRGAAVAFFEKHLQRLANRRGRGRRRRPKGPRVRFMTVVPHGGDPRREFLENRQMYFEDNASYALRPLTEETPARGAMRSGGSPEGGMCRSGIASRG